MRTNYEKLNAFEVAALFVVFCGIALISTIFFSGLNLNQQQNVFRALSMLDIHEQAAQQVQGLSLVFETTHNFYQQFYLAFNQVATLPDQDIAFWQTADEQVKVALNNLSVFSEQVALSYGQANQGVKPMAIGSVAGATIVNPDLESKSSTVSPYIFHPPTWEWSSLHVLLTNYLKP